MQQITDNLGNLLIANNNGKSISVQLQLKSEQRPRNLGVITIASRTMDVKRHPVKHTLRAANAYGFNYNLLHDALTFDYVRLTEQVTRKVFLLKRTDLLEVGEFLFFKEQGFEKQLFVNKGWIAKHEIPPIPKVKKTKKVKKPIPVIASEVEGFLKYKT